MRIDWRAAGVVAGALALAGPAVAGAQHFFGRPELGHGPEGEHRGPGDRFFNRRVKGPENGTENTESLGSQTVDGLEATGTRTTVTIPAGAIGNERPIEVVSERWYSPELQVVVSST